MSRKAIISTPLIFLVGYFALNILLIYALVFLNRSPATSWFRFILLSLDVWMTLYLIHKYRSFLSFRNNRQHLIRHLISQEKEVHPENQASPLYKNMLSGFVRLYKSGKPARANVLSVAEIGYSLGNNPFLKVYLRVFEKDSTAHEMEAHTITNHDQIPRIGDVCTIKFHPKYKDIVLITELNQTPVELFQ